MKLRALLIWILLTDACGDEASTADDPPGLVCPDYVLCYQEPTSARCLPICSARGCYQWSGSDWSKVAVDCPGALPDAGLDGGREAGAAACQEERAFLASHRACDSDDDCVIVGACSGGFGFAAVQSLVRAEAQAYSDDTACGYVFDGPTYNAVCENAQCVARNNGRACGQSQDAAVCAVGQELYPARFDSGSLGECRKRCTNDTSCGDAGVCRPETLGVTGSQPITVSLCR